MVSSVNGVVISTFNGVCAHRMVHECIFGVGKLPSLDPRPEKRSGASIKAMMHNSMTHEYSFDGARASGPDNA